MGHEYIVSTKNLVTDTIASLKTEDFDECDPKRDMSAVELRDFWWAYCYDLLERLPMAQTQNPEICFAVRVSDRLLLEANNATLATFTKHRVGSRLRRDLFIKFSLKHLLPKLAEKISPELRRELEELIPRVCRVAVGALSAR